MSDDKQAIRKHFSQILQLADAVMITNDRHQICCVNEAYERITGYRNDEVVGKNAGVLRAGKTPPETYQHMYEALAANEPWSGVFTNRRRTGEMWHSSITITPYYVEDKLYYVGVFRILEELERGEYLDEQRVDNLKGSLLKALAISCEIRDPGIENHLIRVQSLCDLLVHRYAEMYDIQAPSSYISQVINGSILHDIGKSAIPEGILYKPGSLAPYERKIIEMHPQIGVDILDKINGELDDDLLANEFVVSKNIILHHHERWDGTGYPYKLKENDIPLEARIVSVVDVYDALTTKRPYKEKWAQKSAIEWLIEQKGKQFDPEVVDAFVSLYEEGALD